MCVYDSFLRLMCLVALKKVNVLLFLQAQEIYLFCICSYIRLQKLVCIQKIVVYGIKGK
jgi:hypothetical protein